RHVVLPGAVLQRGQRLPGGAGARLQGGCAPPGRLREPRAVREPRGGWKERISRTAVLPHHLSLVHKASSLGDLKLHLQSTDYGNFLANEASPLTVSVIDDKLKEKMVVEFRHMRNHAYEPLASFLDFITICFSATACSAWLEEGRR
uniref:ATPase H+ transporting V0 subunit d1 n=1 Tax=Apteryx owenii TaxID=8824 RepID=A0A8B9PBP5_APTOW